MRQRIITALAALVYFAVGYAGNISVDAITLKPGEAKDLKISLSSSVGHKVGVQFDVTLPDGFSLVNYSDSKVYHISSNQVSDMTCEVSDLGNNSYKFILYSSTLQELKAGELMSLNLKVTSGKALGNYNISVSNVAFSDVDGNVTKESGVSATVKVTDFFKLIYKVDGVEYKSFDVEYGSSITPESAPTKEGYTFSGWSMIPATMPAQDVTVTGSFTKGAYKLTYMVDGEVYKTLSYDYGSTITSEPAPTKEGYTFSGWSEIPATMPAKDVTVTGSFSINKYKLIYKVDGIEYKSSEVEYGKAITPEAEPTKEGYTFSGWSEIPATMPAHDVTVTGTFTINKYKLTYKVDGEVYKSYDVEYGAAITPEAAPTKEGYTFSRWSMIPATMPAQDVTVTGSFTKGAYKLTYMVDGEVYKTLSYDYGSTITSEPAPTKEGYTFSGWSEIPATMPAKDVTVTGSFSINKYKLIYKVDGIEYKSSEVEYGKAITPEAEPTKEGYTFSGWSEIPETMPAKDVTVTGTFAINQYTITYKIDDEVYQTENVDYGSMITPPNAPEREGYTFEWIDVPETMPTHDITIIGSYTSGINAIRMDAENGKVFDLNGRQVKTPGKGVYIINGRKVVVK